MAGQLQFIMDGKTYTRNFKYVVFQDRDGFMTEPIECFWNISLSTGKKEPSDERIIQIIEDPASIRRRNPKDLFPAKVDPLFAYLGGCVSTFALMVIMAFIG